MMPLIVTAAIIRKERKILIAQRYVKTDHALKWEFPGGKLEEGETPEICLTREIEEELNFKIKVGDIFKVVYHEYKDKTILLLCYICDFLEGQIKALECNDFCWVSVEELNNYEVVEADIPILKKITALGDKIFEIDQ